MGSQLALSATLTQENLNKYVIDRPKRHALDDCNKAVSISRSKNALGIEKGEFLSKLAIRKRTDQFGLCTTTAEHHRVVALFISYLNRK